MTGKTEPEKINVVVLSLTVAALSVWGAFSQAGDTLDEFCHGYGKSSRAYMIALMVMVGATLALYGQRVGGLSSKRNSQNENLMYSVTLAAHIGLIVTTWLLYLDNMDGADDKCNEFIGRQNMFLNIAFVAITVSLTYLLDIIVRKSQSPVAKAWYTAFLYAGVVFLFFFYATAPETGSGNFEDSHQQQWTLITSGVVLLVVYGFCYRKEKKRQSAQQRGLKHENQVMLDPQQESYCGQSFATWFKIANVIVAVVVFVNWLLAILIVENDLEHIANNAQKTNSSTQCFADHHDVLHMNMTSTGFWTLYIILLTAAFIQSLARAMHDVTSSDNFARLGPFVYTDKKDGWNMPTAIIVFTWVWILVALIVHWDEYTDESCGYDANCERAIIILHSIGVLVVVFLLPLYYNRHAYVIPNRPMPGTNMSDINDGNIADEQRPKTRFTTKAQVAVDVNTPLNFA